MEGMLKVLVFCIIVGMIFAMVFGGYEELTKTELEDCQFEAVVEFKYAEDGKYYQIKNNWWTFWDMYEREYITEEQVEYIRENHNKITIR